MTEILYFDISLIAIDLIIIRTIRKFLIDFLRTKRNKKSAAKIYAMQSEEDKITLAFIKPLLSVHVTAFTAYQKLYMALLYTLIPQYLIVILCNVFLKQNSIFVIAVFGAIKIGIYFFIKLHTDANGASIYRRH